MKRKGLGAPLSLAIVVGLISVLIIPACSLSAVPIGTPGSKTSAAVAGGTLDPNTIPKFKEPLTIPDPMPSAGKAGDVKTYSIAAKQFTQQVLPKGMPKTPVWGYGNANGPDPGKPGSNYSWPSATIEASQNDKVQVTWINGLVDNNGKFLPPLLPVDQTLHWANPPGPRDSQGTSQKPYQGPVPLVTHLHGAHVAPVSDGNPEAWTLPDAKNIPAGYFKQGSEYSSVKPAPAGAAIYQYTNDQRPATLWYHDHTMGMTRTTVYSGLSGFYLIRGDAEDKLGLPAEKYEIPLLMQDRSFNKDGSLFYPDNRAFFEGLEKAQLQIPFEPSPAIGGPSDVAPIWNPEFFGNTMTVNGKTWPFLNVEPRQYRFRLLNGSDSRFLMLKLSNGKPFWQIGADGGLLPQAAQMDRLLLAPAERADVIVDFTGIAAGTTFILQNVGPDEPFGGGEPGVDFAPADPTTTGQVMQFKVVKLSAPDKSTPISKLKLPALAPLGPATNTRQVSLNEAESETVFVTTDAKGNIVLTDPAKGGVPFAPTEAMLGTLNPDGTGNPLEFMDAITENPALNATEVWEIYNFTEDAHPIHLHLVQFQIVNRQDMATGAITGPEAGETGTKDTVIAYPGQITRVKAKFDIAGLYLWHCHILSHEDQEMMRPYFVGKMPTMPTMPKAP